jgi:hypothetical protein
MSWNLTSRLFETYHNLPQNQEPAWFEFLKNKTKIKTDPHIKNSNLELGPNFVFRKYLTNPWNFLQLKPKVPPKI